jgi:glyoxylase-like metal-dependent hydrolase (beta-lactamase superfamily II)
MVLEATPGHTPGHTSVRISSEGAVAFISGDVVHHPAQLARPAWSCTWDSDPVQARATRLAFLERLAATGAVLFGTHFARAPAGTVARDGDVHRFETVAPEA